MIIIENTILVIIIIAVLILAIVPTVKHFKGQGGCCGGGGYTPKKKKLKNVIAKKTFRVDGMHCQNCANRVMETVNDIDGLSADVKLKQGTVTVSYETDVADEVIKEKIEAVGYTVL